MLEIRSKVRVRIESESSLRVGFAPNSSQESGPELGPEVTPQVEDKFRCQVRFHLKNHTKVRVNN